MSFNIKSQDGRISSISPSNVPSNKDTAESSQFSKILNERPSQIEPEQIQTNTAINRRSLHFSVNDSTGDTVIEVVDKETDEIIRTIPQEEFNQFIQTMNTQAGSFINTKV